MEEAQRLKALRMQLLEQHPFWGHLLLQVELIPAPELETFAATDGIHRIWYAPHLTTHLSMKQLGFVLAHEVGHQLLASLPRQQGRDPMLWNCATDYAINRMVALIEDPVYPGYPLYQEPSGEIPGLGAVKILQDPKYDGMIAEMIYEQLVADRLPKPKQAWLVLADGDGEALPLPEVLDHCGGIDVHLPGELTDAQRDELATRVAAAVGAWAASGERGDAPGDLVREIQRHREHRVPWRRLLRAFAGQAIARDDYSLARPNPRYLGLDVVVPGMYSEHAAQLVVAADTSGSMTDAQVAAVAAELEALIDAEVEVTLLVADAKVQEIVSGASLGPYLRARHFRGGGGTDHRPVFEKVSELRLRPDLFVGLTDLWTALPSRPPPYPVLWITPEKHGEAPWGRVLEITNYGRRDDED